jgi:hypothetical protein
MPQRSATPRLKSWCCLRCRGLTVGRPPPACLRALVVPTTNDPATPIGRVQILVLHGRTSLNGVESGQGSSRNLHARSKGLISPFIDTCARERKVRRAEVISDGFEERCSSATVVGVVGGGGRRHQLYRRAGRRGHRLQSREHRLWYRVEPAGHRRYVDRRHRHGRSGGQWREGGASHYTCAVRRAGRGSQRRARHSPTLGGRC